MVLPEQLEYTLENLPRKPGVYRLRDHGEDVLYVGKSKDLRDRVRTYFQGTPRNRKTAYLRSLTKSIDFLVLESDQQAREVEWDVIRSHSPKYNTLYLDYWNRPYVELTTNEAYPALRLTQTKRKQEAEYFGPFKSTRRLREILLALRETVSLRDCDLDIPPGGDPDSHDRCFEYHLGRCSAPCVGEESVESYRSRLDCARAFLNGDYETVIQTLRTRMKASSRERNYEAAAVYRDRLTAVKNIVEYESFLRNTLQGDFWNNYENKIVRLSVREHRLKNFQIFNCEEPLGHFLKKYYGDPPVGKIIGVPDDVTLPKDLEEYRPSPPSSERARLLKVARMTAKANNSCHYPGLSSEVRDEIRRRKGELIIERIVDGRTSKTKHLPIGNGQNSLKSRLISHYRKLAENGNILPEKVIIEDDDKGPAEFGEDLFDECDFEIPFYVPTEKAVEPTGKC